MTSLIYQSYRWHFQTFRSRTALRRVVGDAPIFGMHYSLAKGGSVSVGDKVLFLFLFQLQWLLLCLMFPALISKQLFTLFDLRYVWNSFKITRTRNNKIHNNSRSSLDGRLDVSCCRFLFYFDPSFKDLDYVLQVWVRNISTSCV